MSTLLLATSNTDKIQEMTSLLSSLNLDVLSINDFADYPDVIEDQDTLEGNAIKKAQEFAAYFDMPTLADDTGLEVDALKGAPGVFSARYSGPNADYSSNVDKLLNEMHDVPSEKRGAQFRTIMALALKDDCFTVEGICKGIIVNKRRGSGGFGYDPVFYVPELDKTFAEMSLDEKNKISHRGLALVKMKELIISKFGA